ncbi:MAG: Cysteine synthase [Synergistetes bacterium ADurb.Bin155]|jgi:cysteine synthase|nr:pyridoxal-5-phosphate-dependent protein subunit beta [Synergistales bacterium]NMD18105.1 pyridoxal-5-phosphate-dependent protein subunit beta [Synergistaceae bacterium]OQB44698.1 MAG: Cysteine synthase [Synergistetes bacterium ADurb.Bin155]MBP8996631.1 pyridoxal-5-phosphate-dependent protein subunit beta [Synergistales bacterium]HOC81889.1 pyridoxal-5-phosphate-dependent protein subunit beta [Synergistales bacterium]
MIDLTINDAQLERTVGRARERNIVVPTFEQMKDPGKIPMKVREKLKTVGLWDVDPANLFRVTWKNEPVPSGGLFGGVNFLELPGEITGVDARVVALVGKWFPTGSHKVGPTLGCLVPRLVTGQFDPTAQKAVWPSTGNYCRGGAYNSQLLACDSIAILPEGMSRERFEWLKTVAGEVIATPGSESNVKEIFDKTWELRRTRDDVVVFNQFEEFGNYLWHHEVTGSALEEAFSNVAKPGDRFFGVTFTSGSAGTLAAGDHMKKIFPASKIAVGEALQCPTLLLNGFGAHRIEGIGDKHVPWIHNVRNTDMVIDVDDADCMALIRLFNEPAGRGYLESRKLPRELIDQLPLMGISSAANVIMAIKMAKYYELTAKDIIFTVFTDSMELYGSRLREMEESFGVYGPVDAAVDHHRSILGLGTDWMKELSYYDRRGIHNLKYYTWIEQQGRDLEELNAQWYQADEYWGGIPPLADRIDEKIRDFNRRTGLLEP